LAKSEEFATKLGDRDFTSNTEWLDRFLLLTKLLFFFRSASPYLCDHKIKNYMFI
jgi:hypothetical protein